MNCLYESKVNKRKCNCLMDKNCIKCSFYKEDTEENYQNYIVQVEDDIRNYRKKVL